MESRISKWQGNPPTRLRFHCDPAATKSVVFFEREPKSVRSEVKLIPSPWNPLLSFGYNSLSRGPEDSDSQRIASSAVNSICPFPQNSFLSKGPFRLSVNSSPRYMKEIFFQKKYFLSNKDSLNINSFRIVRYTQEYPFRTECIIRMNLVPF